MALAKRVKSGGSYYKGYKLVVSATPANYILNMVLTQACVVNGITVIPDAYGTGDYFTLEHLDENGALVKTLADTIYNVGANAAWQFDFAALEEMLANHSFRLTYTNVAGVAINVYTCVERIR
jgi:hypothetical protein